MEITVDEGEWNDLIEIHLITIKVCLVIRILQVMFILVLQEIFSLILHLHMLPPLILGTIQGTVNYCLLLFSMLTS